jgi:hypothetical protein
MRWLGETMLPILFYIAKIYHQIGGLVVVVIAIFIVTMVVILWSFRMRWISIVVIVLLSSPFLWFASGFFYETWNTYTHRYRLSIEVETPGGIKIGSSIIQISVTGKADWILQSPGAYTGAKGEAVFIDLGNGRNVIATLGFGPTGANTDMLTDLAAEAFGRNQAFWYKQAPSWEGRAELHGDLIPTLVTFANPADPSTLRVVKPDEFEVVFGPGYRFKGAWIEMTKDSVTRVGIEEKLPWLNHMEQYRRDPKNPFTNMLPFNTLQFARGFRSL